MELATFGVEEEFLVVDAETLELVPRSDELLGPARAQLGDDVTPELNLCQIEVGTPVCRTLDEAEGHLVRLRRGLAAAGEDLGLAVAATATHPVTSWRHQQIDLSNERYSRMDDSYQMVARQQVICGCHVHVGIDDPDLAVAVMNRVRPWMPALLALSANSPYWRGLDSGFDSYRLQVWQRWPMAGMQPELGSRQDFDELVGTLEAADAIEDSTFLYWYARPSARFPTLEFRVTDVCLDVDDAVGLAGLIRGLAWTCAAQELAGEEAQTPPTELMEAATWRAARYGLSDTLISPAAATAQPARDVLVELLAFARDGLDHHGDTEQVTTAVKRVLARGNGASRQRAMFAERGELRDVVAGILRDSIPTVR
jgi:carboxylate-amine ligase